MPVFLSAVGIRPFVGGSGSPPPPPPPLGSGSLFSETDFNINNIGGDATTGSMTISPSPSGSLLTREGTPGGSDNDFGFVSALRGTFPFQGSLQGSALPAGVISLEADVNFLGYILNPTTPQRFHFFIALYYFLDQPVTIGSATHQWLDTQRRLVYDSRNGGFLSPGTVETYDPGDSFGTGFTSTDINPGSSYHFNIDIESNALAAMQAWGIPTSIGHTLRGIEIGTEGFHVDAVNCDWPDYQLNTAAQKVTRSKTYTTDIQIGSPRKTHTTNILLKATNTKTQTTDINITAFARRSQTHTTDILLKSTSLTKTYSTDIRNIVRSSKTYTTDIALGLQTTLTLGTNINPIAAPGGTISATGSLRRTTDAVTTGSLLEFINIQTSPDLINWTTIDQAATTVTGSYSGSLSITNTINIRGQYSGSNLYPSWHKDITESAKLQTIAAIFHLPTGSESFSGPSFTTSINDKRALPFNSNGITGTVRPNFTPAQPKGYFIQINGVKVTSVNKAGDGESFIYNGIDYDDTDINITGSGGTSTQGIHCEADMYWRVNNLTPWTGSAGVPTGSGPIDTPSVGQIIDVQGYLFWDPGHVGDAGHFFSGWEIHPLTAWRDSSRVIHMTGSA